MPLGETEAATCRTMKESRYLFRYFGVCAQRAEVSRFRCAYRCRYKAVEPSPRGSAAPTGGIGPEWPRWNWRLQVPTRGWMRLGIVRVATARLSDATGVITGPIMDSRLQSETAFNVNDRNPFDCRAIHATFHRRVDREQTVGTHSMRGIETEIGPASAGPFPCLKSVVGRGLSTSRTLCSVSFSCLIRVTGNISMFRFHPCVLGW